MRLSEGRLRHITIPATAGNVVYTTSPGVGKRWLLLYGRFVLVCDGTVASRTLQFLITDAGANSLNARRYGAATTAGLTKSMSFGTTIVTSGGTFADDAVHSTGGTEMLEGTDIFRMLVSAGVAGDSYSGYLTVLETYV